MGDVAQFAITVQYAPRFMTCVVLDHPQSFRAISRERLDINLRFRELADSLLLGHVRSRMTAEPVWGHVPRRVAGYADGNFLGQMGFGGG